MQCLYLELGLQKSSCQQRWGMFCLAFRTTLFFSAVTAAESDLNTSTASAPGYPQHTGKGFTFFFFRHFIALHIFRGQGSWRWEGRTVSLTTDQIEHPNSLEHEAYQCRFLFSWISSVAKCLFWFLCRVGGVPLEYEQPTIPSAVPEDPAVTSSVSTPTQQNLQSDVTSTCKFGLS